METQKIHNQTHRCEISKREISATTKFQKYPYSVKAYQLTPKAKFFPEKLICNYVYASLEEAQQFALDYLNRISTNLKTREAEKMAKRKANAEVKASDFYQVGDIVVNTWGYEQTNVDFYKVISMTGKTIKVQEIGEIQSGYESHGMACQVMPDPDRLFEKVYNLRVKAEGRLSSPKSYYYFHKHSGRSQYKSWYA
jgi:hypothetical protein